MCNLYVNIEGMTWPNPLDPGKLISTLTWGTPDKNDLLLAASYISAYQQLFKDGQKIRNWKIQQIKNRLGIRS